MIALRFLELLFVNFKIAAVSKRRVQESDWIPVHAPDLACVYYQHKNGVGFHSYEKPVMQGLQVLQTNH